MPVTLVALSVALRLLDPPTDEAPDEEDATALDVAAGIDDELDDEV
jgi:hypothetical protein